MPRGETQRVGALKILICVRDFVPDVGGVQHTVLGLASGLAREPDTQVTVVTSTPANGYDDAALPFAVVRDWRPLAACRRPWLEN